MLTSFQNPEFVHSGLINSTPFLRTKKIGHWKKGVCVPVTNIIHLVVKREIPESSCGFASYFAGRSFSPKTELTGASCPQRASLEVGLWKFYHKHTPTHLAHVQTMNNLAFLPSRAVFCMSHLLLSLYFGLFASGNHKDLSNTVLRQLSVLSEQWTIENLLKRLTPLLGVHGNLGLVPSSMVNQEPGLK